MTTIIKVVIGLIPFAIGVIIWVKMEMKTAPQYGKCLKCGGDFPKFYITQKGVCQACHKKSDAYNSMGYPRIEHFEEKQTK